MLNPKIRRNEKQNKTGNYILDAVGEYENFEKLAKKLLHLSPELEKIKREEKEHGIEPDALDFEPAEEEKNN